MTRTNTSGRPIQPPGLYSPTLQSSGATCSASRRTALAAAKATLTHLQEQGPEMQQRLTKRTSAFAEELNDFWTDFSAAVDDIKDELAGRVGPG